MVSYPGGKCNYLLCNGKVTIKTLKYICHSQNVRH